MAVQVQAAPCEQSSHEAATPCPAAADYVAAEVSADGSACKLEPRAAMELEPEGQIANHPKSSRTTCTSQLQNRAASTRARFRCRWVSRELHFTSEERTCRAQRLSGLIPSSCILRRLAQRRHHGCKRIFHGLLSPAVGSTACCSSLHAEAALFST